MKTATPSIRLGVVILAAGASTRMGRPKLLLPWHGTTILGHLLREWRSSLGAEQITVVCAEGNEALEIELDRLGIPPEDRVPNPHPETGMLDSIRLAAQWPGRLEAPTHWGIVLGDQPHLRRSTLERLIEFASEHPDQISQPGFNGRRRHPVILPRMLFGQLADSPAASLREFLRSVRNRLAVCEMVDPGLDIDIDTPEDYRRAVAMSRRPLQEKH